MIVCKRVTYWGRVQGVGFRYTTHGLAQHYPVTGYVKNLLNGHVELVAEGEAADVERFLTALAEQMRQYIKGHSVEDETPRGLGDFTIRA